MTREVLRYEQARSEVERSESKLDKGTRFQVYLPAVPSTPSSQAEAGTQVVAPGRRELVLVIDDEAFIRDITRRNLEAHGYQVLTAREGTEARSE